MLSHELEKQNLPGVTPAQSTEIDHLLPATVITVLHINLPESQS
jgi:hypothetical protein